MLLINCQADISMGFQIMMLSFMELCMFVLEDKTVGIQSLFENEQAMECYKTAFAEERVKSIVEVMGFEVIDLM